MKSYEMAIAEAVIDKTLDAVTEAMHREGRELPGLAACVDLDAVVADIPKPEPVGIYVGIHKGHDVVNLVDDLSIGTKLYAEPPVAEINTELLEALRDFSDYVHTEQCATDGSVQYSNTQINRLAFKARAAIAKAEGETK